MLITDLQDKRPNKAPIVIFDKNELGDKRLDPTESLAKIKEENAKLAQKSRIKHQDELENTEMALGQPMQWRNLVYLLQKMNSKILIRDGGVRDAIQVRYPDADDMYSRANGGDGTRYITGFYKEVMPEFSAIMSDERGRPKRECRGWRTVLVALIRQGIITYKSAVDVFGDANGIRAGRWQEILRDKRV